MSWLEDCGQSLFNSDFGMVRGYLCLRVRQKLVQTMDVC